MFDLDERIVIVSDAAHELQVRHERLRLAVEKGEIETVYRSKSGRPYLRFGDARDYIERKRRQRKPYGAI